MFLRFLIRQIYLFPELPSLTTIHIHSETMGLCAMLLLITRIRNPFLDFRTIHVETNLIYRESTEDVPNC